MKTLALAVLAFFACAGTALADGGFKVEGDSLENMKLSFDETGLDRSTPEAAAASFLKVVYSVRADARLELRFESLSVAHTEKLLGAFLTDDEKTEVLGALKKRIADLEKTVGDQKPPRIEVTAKDEAAKDLADVVDFKVHTSSKRPCWKCEEKTDPSCGQCKGSGFVEREDDELVRVTLKKDAEKKDVWRVAHFYTQCWACKGAKQECPNCKNTRFREDDFLKGPPSFDEVDAKAPKADLSTPEAAFDSLAGALRAVKASELAARTKLKLGFDAFKAFLIDPGYPEAEKRKIDVKAHERLEVTKNEDGSVYVTFARPNEARKGETGPAGRVKLVKQGDAWKVATFEERCWECGYGGDQKKCGTCNKTGFVKAKDLPY
jgi:hypothetical protein